MTFVPFSGLSTQSRMIRCEVDRRIAGVLNHGQFIMGPEVGELEVALSDYCGARHTICVANGTDALQICLMAIGVGPGDAIFIPSFTYTATAEVILLLGAQPVFVDVSPETFNLDPADLERAMLEAHARNLRPKAIIGVDLFGLPAPWEDINLFAKKHGLIAIADAAQSFGASQADGRHVGLLATLTTTSFFPAKPLGCYGDGGAIFTQDDSLADVIRSIRVHGQGKAKYETIRVGVNSRLDTIQAAILLAKLTIFADEIKKRNALACRYSEHLRDLVAIPQIPDGVISAWAQYTIRVEHRDEVQKYIGKAGIPSTVYYPLPMHLQSAYKSYGRGEGSLPVSEKMSEQVLSLPMSPYWEEWHVNKITDEFIRFSHSVGSILPK